MPTLKLDIQTPRWAVPLLSDHNYKGARGGRGGGKSHFFAELLVEEHVCNPNQRSVCIREIQNTLEDSVKRLIEEKIYALGVDHLFDIQTSRIKDKRGKGLIIFKGMQDYNATNIKSLEGFDRAWVEEAQNLSKRSLEMLDPTIRKTGSQIWFSWNPDNKDDPVERFFANPSDDMVLVHCNIHDNPFRSELLWSKMQKAKETLDIGEYNHIWLGGYRVLSKEQIFADKCKVATFTPGENWDGPYYGGDFGYSDDPCAAVELWLFDNCLYVYRESYKHQLTMDNIAKQWRKNLPGIEKHVVRADSARPDTINHVKTTGKHGDRPNIPHIVGATKGKGSVEDGIEYLRNFKAIFIHPDCEAMQAESQNYKWKTNRAGDPLPTPVDAENHLWDSIRYALEPLIKAQQTSMEALQALYG